MRFYLYDDEKDTHGREDALGNADDGLTEIKLDAWNRLIARAEDGTEFEFSPTHRGDGVEIRNNHRRGIGGMAVVPRSSNVFEVFPDDR